MTRLLVVRGVSDNALAEASMGDAMTSNRDKIPAIKELLEAGQYRVDPHATADAILLRLRAHQAVLRAPVSSAQIESQCSEGGDSRLRRVLVSRELSVAV